MLILYQYTVNLINLQKLICMKTETAALSAPLTDLISLEGKMFLT